MRFLKLGSGTLVPFPSTRPIRTGGMIQAVTRPSSLTLISPSPWQIRLPGEVGRTDQHDRHSAPVPGYDSTPACPGGTRHYQASAGTQPQVGTDVGEKNRDRGPTQTSSRRGRKPRKSRRKRVTPLRKRKRSAPAPPPPKKAKEEEESDSDDVSEAAEDGDGEEYEVERVEGVRLVGERTEYLIKWAGYGADVNSWRPVANLNCYKLIKAYWRRRKLETTKMGSAGDRRRA